MFCYDFALKMTKIMINCSHVPASYSGFEGMLIRENVGKWRNLKCILIRFFPHKILEIFTYCTKIMLL